MVRVEKMRLTALFKKNLLVFAIILSFLIVSVLTFSSWTLHKHLTNEYKSKGVAIANSIASSSVEVLLNRDPSTVQAVIDQFLTIEGISYVFVIDSEGEIISHTFVPSVPKELLNIKTSSREIVVSDLNIAGKGDYINIASPILGGVAGYVHVGMDKGLIKSYIMSAILGQSSIIAVIFFSGFLITYIFFKRHINTPLSKLTDYTNNMLAHNYSASAGIESDDEFQYLATAIEKIAIHFQQVIERSELTVRELSETSKELNDVLSYLSAIIDNMADGLLVTDTEGRIIRVNHALLEMFGFRREEISHRNIDDILSVDMTGWLEESVSSDKKEVLSAEIDLPLGRSGKALATPIYQKPDDFNASLEGIMTHPKQKSDGLVCIGVVILIRDITKEKEIDRMKTDFISTVSHELRTPLTSILGFAKIIKKKLYDNIFPHVRTEEDKTQKATHQVSDDIDIIVSEGERLTALINNVLDIAKMEAGRVEWKMTTLKVSEMIDRAISATALLIEQKGLSLIKNIADKIPDITGDRDRLVQAMINLISNAVKFTENGSVTCTAEKMDDYIKISVIDTGIGIAKEEQEKVFEKFKQIGDTLTDKPKGTGLGLPICKQIVDYHGGTIWIESEPGKGSNFSFTIPIKKEGLLIKTIDTETFIRQLKEHVEIASSSRSEGLKTILVVDDDANIRNFLRQVLEAEGYSVEEARNGIEAISRVKKNRIDLIILDIMMPNMSGFDVAAIIKNDPITMAIPIIILSILEDRERGYRIGIDRYLTKPVNTEELLRGIDELITRGTSRKKILVVDEDVAVVNTISEVLIAKGFHVVGACNGPECLDKARSQRPDMIIIDALISNQNDIVKTLKFEKGLENIMFLLLGR